MHAAIERSHEMQPHPLGAKACRAGTHSHHQQPKVVHAVKANHAGCLSGRQQRAIPEGGALFYLRHCPGPLREPALPWS